MSILCYSRSGGVFCTERHSRLIVVRPHLEKVECKKDEEYPCGVRLACHGSYQALCRAHFKAFAKGKIKFHQWTGRLVADLRGGACSHPRCSFAATNFYWRREHFVVPNFSNSWRPITSTNSLIPKEPNYQYCQFHSDEAEFGTLSTTFSRYRKIPREQYDIMLVTSVLEE